MLDPLSQPAFTRPPPPPGSGAGGSPLRLPPTVAALLLVMAVLMLLRQVASPSLDAWLITTLGLSLFEQGVFEPQRLPTLLSSLFLHADWFHLLFNGLWIAVFGSLLQPILGSLRLLILFFVTAAMGGLLYEAANWGGEQIAVGSSGAAFGLFGAYAHLMVAHPLESRGAKLRKLLAFTVLMLAVNYAYGMLGALPGMGRVTIAWEAHAGSFLAGLILFPLLRPARRSSVTANPHS